MAFPMFDILIRIQNKNLIKSYAMKIGLISDNYDALVVLYGCDGVAPTHNRCQTKCGRAPAAYLRIIDIEPNLDAHHFTI